MTVVALRQFTIGGSDAAAAAGVDPHRSRVMLWLEKTGRAQREETEVMRWGTLLEPLVMAELEERGYALWTPEHGEPRYERHDSDRPWLVGHPDGLVTLDGESALLEIKTVGQWAHHANGGMVPLGYAAQVQHYLHLTGLTRALLAVLVGGQRLELMELPRDDNVIRLLLAAEEDFYGYLCRDECPPVGPSDRDALLLLHPSAAQGRMVRLDSEQMGWLDELRARREQLDAVTAQKDELENRLKAAMGDAELAIAPNDAELIRWRNVESTRTDVRGLRAAHPEIAARYVTTTQTRRFTLL